MHTYTLHIGMGFAVATLLCAPFIAVGATESQAHAYCSALHTHCKKSPQSPECKTPQPIPITVAGVPGVAAHCTCFQGASVIPECKGISATGLDGKSGALSDANQFMQLVNGAMGLLQGLKGLMGGGQGGGSGGGIPSAPPPPPPANFGGTQIPLDLSPAFSTTSSSGSGTNTGGQTNTAGDILQSIIGSGSQGSQTGTGGSGSGLADPSQPAPNFLDAVAKGFGSITDKVSEFTAGVVSPGSSGTGSGSGSAGGTAAPKDKTDVRETDDDITFEAGLYEEGKSGVVGFYGVSGGQATFGSQDATVVGRLCTARPWSTGLVSRIIAPSFFDGLCERLGHTPGGEQPETDAGVPLDTTLASRQAIGRTRAAANGAVASPVREVGLSCTPDIIREGGSAALEWSCGASQLVGTSGFRTTTGLSRITVNPKQDTTYAIKCADDFIDTCTVRVIRPQVAIWSEPAEVRLGTRAVIKWNTADVFEDSCTIDGPSFHEASPRGGASTAAINDPVTYTIACRALDGATTTASVTVGLGL